MTKHSNKLRIQVSWLWLPYIMLLPFIPLAKIIGYVFLMLSIHEMAHVLCAFLFHYPCKKIMIYPFGIGASIEDVGLGNVYAETCILAAGPLTHVCMPYLFHFFLQLQWISQPFYSYLCMMNASLLLFNLLPIYPLDGGRLLQTFFHCFMTFEKANRVTLLCSGIFLIMFISMSILNGFSAWMIFVFLFLQLYMAYRNLSYTTLKFYHYRYRHSTKHPILLHDKNDLYRARYNVMKDKKGWWKEEQWLAHKFFQNRSRR